MVIAVSISPPKRLTQYLSHIAPFFQGFMIASEMFRTESLFCIIAMKDGDCVFSPAALWISICVCIIFLTVAV